MRGVGRGGAIILKAEKAKKSITQPTMFFCWWTVPLRLILVLRNIFKGLVPLRILCFDIVPLNFPETRQVLSTNGRRKKTYTEVVDLYIMMGIHGILPFFLGGGFYKQGIWMRVGEQWEEVILTPPPLHPPLTWPHVQSKLCTVVYIQDVYTSEHMYATRLYTGGHMFATRRELQPQPCDKRSVDSLNFS